MKNPKMFAFGSVTIDEIGDETEVGGVINIAKIWSVFVNSHRICLVSQIGDARNNPLIQKRLNEIDADFTYITFVQQCQNKLYRIRFYDGQPIFERIQNAKKLRNVPFPRVPIQSVSMMFFQSLATIFESPYAEDIVRLIETANEIGVPTFLDMNARPASIRNLKSNRRFIDLIGRVFHSLDTLKVNESEARVVAEVFPKIRPRRSTFYQKPLAIVRSIRNSYELKRALLTKGEKGSYLQTRSRSIKFASLTLDEFSNSLGCGDAFSGGYCLRYVFDLSDREGMAIATLLAALQTLERFAYPRSLGKGLVAKALRQHEEFFAHHDVDAEKLGKKLGIF